MFLPRCKVARFLLVFVAIPVAGLQREHGPTPLSDPVEIQRLLGRLRSGNETQRATAVSSLGSRGINRPDIAAALIGALKDKSPRVRAAAAESLWGASNLGDEDDPEREKVIRALNDALEDSDAMVRYHATFALRFLGPRASIAVQRLIERMRTDSYELTRAAAAETLTSVGLVSNEMIPAFRDATHDTNPKVRAAAATSLAGWGQHSREGLPELKALLSDGDPEVRYAAASALAAVGEIVKECDCLRELIARLEDDDRTATAAISALANMGPVAADAVSKLIQIIETPTKENQHHDAIRALGEIGPSAQKAGPTLLKYASNSTSPYNGDAIVALTKIGYRDPRVVDLLLRNASRNLPAEPIVSAEMIGQFAVNAASSKIHPLSAFEDADRKGQAGTALKRARAKLPGILEDKLKTSVAVGDFSTIEFQRRRFDQQLRIIDVAITQLSEDWRIQLLDILRVHKASLLIASSISLILVLCLTLYLARPLILLKLENLLRPTGPLSILSVLKYTANYALFVGYFAGTRRVLDAWVEKQAAVVNSYFLARPTVQSRKTYVDIPVLLEGRVVPALTPEQLQSEFEKQKQRTAILVWGEGGSGKTTLACQVAKWAVADKPNRVLCRQRILPVLIESNLKETAKGAALQEPSAVLGEIRAFLSSALNSTEPISDVLVQRLLRRKRILVVIDHLSELDSGTRDTFRKTLSTYSVNALLVTSRIQESIASLTVQTLRVEGDRLSSFVEAYLNKIKKRQLFKDMEFFDLCKRLSQLVGDRGTTVLLAKLYAEQAVLSKEGTPAALPSTIPDIFLNYLNSLNRNRNQGAPDDLTIRRAAKLSAWEALKRKHRPAMIREEQLHEVLLESKFDDELLQYLIETLQLLQRHERTPDLISFALDPLAEYLAALHVVDMNGSDNELWETFISQAEEIQAREISTQDVQAQEIQVREARKNPTEAFIRAVRDCIKREREAKIPDFVDVKLKALEERSGSPTQGGTATAA
jgi:HEAT repeat protein